MKDSTPTRARAPVRALKTATRRQPPPDRRRPTIGEYLIERLQAMGLTDIFGIPGDFVLGFYGLLEDSPIRVIGTTNELNAGYAADAYARVKGIGAVCVTYSVGGLSLVNAVAGAYAEKSPVIVISGAPGIDERRGDPLLHHRVGPFSTQLEVFSKITVAAVALDDPHTAFREIDRCLDLAWTTKRPVYLELPRDRVDARAPHPHTRLVASQESDPAALAEALTEAAALISQARQPVLYAGVEVHRFGLRRQLLALAERHRIPICASLLSKSVVSERHPLYLGVYEGAMGREDVRRYVEDSDCLIMLGAFLTDIDLGIYTARLDPRHWVFASSEDLRIRHHHYHGVRFPDFVDGLLEAKIKVKPAKLPRMAHERTAPWRPRPQAAVTNRRLFERVNGLLGDGVVVVCDVGDSLFGASDLVIHGDTEFLSPAYYTSMGFAVPAAVGVQVANSRLRPLVIVGDGAFQMTGQELGNVVRHGFNPIVIVMNNRGYTTERFIQEGPFNDIHEWRYHLLPQVYGGGIGFEVRTEGELEEALRAALASDVLTLINVHLAQDDISPALARLAEGLKQRV